MKVDDKHKYVKYRYQRALDAFDDAIILAENRRWNTVVNRLYYSCFYAVIALLLKNNIEVQSHDGVRSQFGLHFIKKGLIDKEYGKLFSKLFDFRQKGDYGDLYDFEQEIVEPLIEQTRKFIEEIGNHIN
ncbi:MAG: HEPN domain-containing protein [Bacteroidales bacterium]